MLGSATTIWTRTLLVLASLLTMQSELFPPLFKALTTQFVILEAEFLVIFIFWTYTDDVSRLNRIYNACDQRQLSSYRYMSDGFILR
jgi:hypothetical protein